MTMIDATPAETEKLHKLAVVRLRRKRGFQIHLLVYVLVNIFLIGIWAVTGAGFLWPIFPLLGWGTGLAFHAWGVYAPHVPSEERIHAEMDRLARRG
jgi:uncharacterized membrane protein